jgi:hypothetical protein
MSTVKLFVKSADIYEVLQHVTMSGVKYYPVRRHGEMVGSIYRAGYLVEMDKNHPIVSYLILKFDLKTLSNDDV